MKEMQLTGIVMMSLMALTLVTLLPRRVKDDRVANRSRWLLTVGLSLIAVQFLVQYLTGLRETSKTLAVIVNLAFFIPAAAHMSLNIINLMRQGHIRRMEWLLGLIAWMVSLGLLTFGLLGGENSSRLFWTEVAASIVYGLMQLCYSWLQLREMSRMEIVLADYYDEEQERDELLGWLKLSIWMLALTTPFVPLLIFSGGWLLSGFALFMFLCIYYIWFCFVRYVITGALNRVSEAEQSAEQETLEHVSDNTVHTSAVPDEAMQRASQAIGNWTASGGYLRSGITKPMAAQEMKLPVYLLSAWIKAQGHASYTRWITTLRVDEAKRALQAHPDWSNEAIADHCGISRSNFQRVFHEITGVTPAKFVTGER
jgi:AraC-like DNA-binding protein